MTTKRDQLFSAIRDEIAAGTRAFLTTFSQDWAGETIYSFLLEVDYEGTSVEAVIGTEEGLLRIAQDYSAYEGKGNEESINCQCIGLRWQGPEDGWYENYNAGFFEGANQLITEACTDGFLEMGDQQLQQLCLEVLKGLDAAGVFGQGETREKITIGLCDVGGDHAEEDFLQWAEVVNPPVVMERLRHELQAANQFFQERREARLRTSEI